MKRRRHFRDLLCLSVQSEMPGDDLALARRQCRDGVIDLLHLLVLDRLGFRIPGRGVGDEDLQRRGVEARARICFCEAEPSN